MNIPKYLFSNLLVTLLCFVPQLACAAKPHLTAVATLSNRSAKPGDHLEIVVSVRAAINPRVLIPTNLTGLHFKQLRKPCLLTVDGGKVWLFRYQVTPKLLGNYEISPISIVDGSTSTDTKPLFLHVSENGELPPLSARELALGVNIPSALSEEVLKASPQPIPMPTSSPTPHDTRVWNEKAASWLGNALKAAWNYPGK